MAVLQLCLNCTSLRKEITNWGWELLCIKKTGCDRLSAPSPKSSINPVTPASSWHINYDFRIEALALRPNFRRSVKTARAQKNKKPGNSRVQSTKSEPLKRAGLLCGRSICPGVSSAQEKCQVSHLCEAKQAFFFHYDPESHRIVGGLK